jgi:hypothetical protein
MTLLSKELTMPDYNLIDALLDDTASQVLGEETRSGKEFESISGNEEDSSFLDEITSLPGIRAAFRTSNKQAAGATSTGVLADAMMSFDSAMKYDDKLKSFEAVVKAGNTLLKQSSIQPDLAKAISRLKRIASKTEEQKAADGAKTASDYADHKLMPHWAGQVRKDVNTIRTAFRKFMDARLAKKASGEFNPDTMYPDGACKTCNGQGHFRSTERNSSIPQVCRTCNGTGGTVPSTSKDKKKATGPEDEKAIVKKEMSDDEARNHIKKLLNDGVEPVKIAAYIQKNAELLGFSKSITNDYLNQNSGVIGYAYHDPSFGMEKCDNDYQRITTKLGGLRAKSVRQINACVDCTHFQKSASDKRCNLFQLPIVANAQELLPIINNLTKGATNKKAALVSQANREGFNRESGVQYIQRGDSPRSTHVMAHVEGQDKQVGFTAADAMKLHKAGAKLTQIYKRAKDRTDAADAKNVMRHFIANLKTSKAKVALNQIDCTLLKGKLSASNAIIGAKKCGSCTYRNGMSCGLTGGTLERFEGMRTARSSGHTIGIGAPKDGTVWLGEFDLMGKHASEDIEMSGDYGTVDAGNGESV